MIHVILSAVYDNTNYLTLSMNGTFAVFNMTENAEEDRRHPKYVV